MKRYFLLLISCFIASAILHGQGLKVYGLQSNTDPSNPNTEVSFNLVSLDPINDILDTLFEINNSYAAVVGSSSFDQGNGNFIFWGIDGNNTSRLYNVNVTNQSNQNNVAITSQPFEIEYDMQTNQAYGLMEVNNSFTSLASIDLTTGAMTPIGSLPDVQAVNIGSSSIDSNNGRYFFRGVDSNYDGRLYTVDVTTGQILHSPELIIEQGNNTYFFQYDVVNDKLYGLNSMWDPSQTDEWGNPVYDVELFLIEVDIQTGLVSNVSPNPIASGLNLGIIVGGVTFEQQSQVYFVEIVVGGTQKVLAVDVNTGTVLGETTLNSTFIELQANNQSFAQSFYGGSTSVEEPLGEESISVFPTPASNMIQIETNADWDEAVLRILDASGQVQIQTNETAINSRVSQFDISNLAPGFYVVEIVGKDKVASKPFIIQR